MRPKGLKWGTASATLLTLVVAAGAWAQGAFYREVAKDGRIYVFNNMQQFDAWEKSGEIGKSLTRLGAGPNNETVVFDSEEAVNLYNFKHNLPGEVFANPKEAPKPSPPVIKGLDDLAIGGLWYLSYQYTDTANQFTIKRGYIDVKKKVVKWGKDSLEARVTPDVTQDDTGDLKLRLKYIYGKFNWQSSSWEPWLEVGLVHMPWLDFEEHVNVYRMQDTMFTERNGAFASADLGATFGGFLGPKLTGPNAPHAYPGKYGSFSVGVYNGGGYHAAEKNKNKVLEGRVTLRPLPDQLQGLQISYFGVTGKGNSDKNPDYTVNLGMVSYEFEFGTLTAQYYMGKGNSGGSAVDADGASLERKGYSVFGEFRIPPSKKVRGIVRYDWFDPNKNSDNNESKRYIAGLAYDVGHANIVLADYEKLKTPGKSDVNRYQLTLQINY
jgi:hypothetical protein